MKATLRHIYMCRTGNMSWRTCVVVKQIQSNPPPLGAGGIMFSGCPSEAWNNLFSPVHGSIGPSDKPWPFCGMSVRPERFPGICQKMHGGNSLKFCMLMYLGHLQSWLDYGHGLLIFLLLVSLWLSEMGQIWGFRAFPGERMVEMACNFASWCILTTFRTDKFW